MEPLQNSEQTNIRADLVSMATHELRASLSAVRWILNMVLTGDAGPLSVQQQNLLEKARASTDRMTAVVQELLTETKMIDALITLHETPGDLVALLDEVIFDFTGEAHAKHIEIVFIKPTPLPPVFAFDQEKIRVVFQNLVENAIKYSDVGNSIFISVLIDTATIAVSVRDGGIGIPEEEKSKIFEKFFRATNAKSKEVDGSGLGLYASKRIIEAHGGMLVFESSPSTGTTFTFSIPLSTKARI